MVKVLVDTSIFIEYARQGRGKLLSLLEQAAQQEIELTTSALVIFEFWSGQSLAQAKNQKQAEMLFRYVKQLPVDLLTAKKAAELQRTQQATGIDALIAATALLNNAQVATLNLQHFNKVDDLKLWQ